MERLRGAVDSATTKISSSAPRRQPSHYPFPSTYVIEFFIFISAAIVTGILGYFIYYLRMDSMSAPYQFILLISISCITLPALVFITYTHVAGSSSPKTSVIIHGGLLIGWLVGLALITGKIGDMVLAHACSTSMWMTNMGVMVCRIYKALYAFIVIGTASIAAATVLDIFVLREMTSRGAYREMKDGNLDPRQKQGLGRSLSGMAAKRSGFGLRGGDYLELKDSPPIGGDDGDMGQRLVGRSPDMRSEYQSPDLSDYEKTPKL